MDLLIAYIIVGIALVKPILFTWYLIRAFLLTKIGIYKDLRKYGEWAVVTGASDGIGKEYAKQLAKYGLNVILISRSEGKLQEVAEEIKKTSTVEVRIIVFDYNNVSEYGKLSAQLEGLDIGILVNNVGRNYGCREYVHEKDIERIVSVMNVNMISDVRMTHLVLPGMFERKRGAIIHISSMTTYLAYAGGDVYASSKTFIKKFAETLMLESKGIVHHQLVTPGYVESNMSRKKPGFTIPSAKDYVASAIKTIGAVDITCGYPSHEFVYLILKFLPKFIIDAGFRMTSSVPEKKE